MNHDPRPARRFATRLRSVGGAAALLLLAGTGCRQDMHDQPRYEALEASRFFADGQASRVPPEGTVARGQLREDAALFRGRDDSGEPVQELPVELDRALLERGRERYDIFCSPCHDRLGDGRGMIVRRGYRQPPSFHIDRLREAEPGYVFDVITNGYGVMPSYASQVPVRDRWAIVAYVRALQLARAVPLEKLEAEDRRAIERAASAAGPDSETAEPGGGHDG